MKDNDTVTFLTQIVPSLEGPRSYRLLGGAQLPKSLTKIEEVVEVRDIPRFKDDPRRGMIRVEVTRVTTPRWLVRL